MDPKPITFFCSHKGNTGYLSQWFSCNFEENNIKFTSAEQYMMYRKALLFDDLETAASILATDDPKEIKKLGREIKNFNQATWELARYQIVLEGNKAKFGQNSELLEKLKATGDTILAEAADYDPIWGIGMNDKDPQRFDQTKWGLNLLGKVLMDVRRTSI